MTPGKPLEKGRDAGGLRWFLDGQPISAGTGVDLAIEVGLSYCARCEGEGVDYDGPRDSDGLAQSCPQCGGRGQIPKEYQWLAVRVEFDHGVALAVLPAAGARAMTAPVPDGARFRWRPDRRIR